MDLVSDLSKDLKAIGNQRYIMQAGPFSAKDSASARSDVPSLPIS